MKAAHVGECPSLVIDYFQGRYPQVELPWPELTIITDAAMRALPARIATRLESEALLLFHVANGFAVYRLVGRAEPEQRTIWELREGVEGSLFER